MKLDCTQIPIRDHDCVVVLDEEFAKYGPKGKNLEYGIVYGAKWILPLNGLRKRQLDTADYVKLLNNELTPEVKTRLHSLYMYYRKYQHLPKPDEEIVELMAEDVAAYNKAHDTSAPLESPFSEDESEDEINWSDDDYDEDDLDTDIYETDDLI